jgi:hypothetical protein
VKQPGLSSIENRRSPCENEQFSQGLADSGRSTAQGLTQPLDIIFSETGLVKKMVVKMRVK